MGKKKVIKAYHGFGHTHDLVLFGHVFNHSLRRHRNTSTNILANLIELIKLFIVKPLPGVQVQLDWEGQVIHSKTGDDGFYRFEWTAKQETTAGWHDVIVKCAGKENSCEQAHGEIFVPHSTQFAFISDIDDTILVSHSYTKLRRLRELLFNKPHSRLVFKDVARHYHLLAAAKTNPHEPNPFFYVSSSEWNLYDYIQDFFEHNELPKGAFLLNQVKRWYQFFRTGSNNHEGKLIRIARLFKIFPRQRFILFGDNSQKDPAIYNKLSKKYGDRIFAVYIRNVNRKKVESTKKYLREMEEENIYTCFFKDSEEAIAHSRQIGLIDAID